MNTLVLAQAHNNGLLYPVWVKEYLGDGIYVTGGTSRLVMLSGESSMINRDNLEIPEGLEDVLPGTKVDQQPLPCRVRALGCRSNDAGG